MTRIPIQFVEDAGDWKLMHWAVVPRSGDVVCLPDFEEADTYYRVRYCVWEGDEGEAGVSATVYVDPIGNAWETDLEDIQAARGV